MQHRVQWSVQSAAGVQWVQWEFTAIRVPPGVIWGPWCEDRCWESTWSNLLLPGWEFFMKKEYRRCRWGSRTQLRFPILLPALPTRLDLDLSTHEWRAPSLITSHREQRANHIARARIWMGNLSCVLKPHWHLWCSSSRKNTLLGKE